ncbi:MAG: M23 family metallopeptidase [Flavobacteriaceae bacterium]|nr:M23 family metallopeptidase [Flavobacteriaceae bacterium]
MAKIKYYYDPETLSYRKIERKKRKTFSYIMLFLTAAGLFGLLFYILSFHYIDSPKAKALKRENENLKLNFEILNKRIVEVEDVLANVQERDENLYRIHFEAASIPDEQRLAGFGGVNRYRPLEGYENSELIINTTKEIDKLSKQLVVQSKSLDEIIQLAENKEKLLASIPAIQPVSNEDLTRMASGFGFRSDPFTKRRKMHYGMDFTAPRGTPIYATGDGTVVRADSRSSGYGKHIRIDHGFGYTSLYAHLYRYKVRVGQKVKRGDLIGLVGSTGRSQAPHLHYEVHKDGDKINPIHFYYGSLSAKEFAAILEQSKLENQSLD